MEFDAGELRRQTQRVWQEGSEKEPEVGEPLGHGAPPSRWKCGFNGQRNSKKLFAGLGVGVGVREGASSLVMAP